MRFRGLSIACMAGAKREGEGGREEGAKGKSEGSACSESLCFCITLTNFLVIRLRLLSIKCRYTRQSGRKAEPSGYAGINLICLELTSPLPFFPPFPPPYTLPFSTPATQARLSTTHAMGSMY